MNLLLDTHSFLWFIMGSSKLSSNARLLIEDISNYKFVSMASIWEIAIKLNLGKLTLSNSFDTIIPSQIINNGFQILGIQIQHISIITSLPLHHRDPFDRILIAQCIFENYSIVSADTAFDNYSIIRLW